MRSNESQTSEELRQRVCDHLADNYDIYKGFLTNNDVIGEDTYMQNINYLREEGHWSNELADAMPLAVSNMLGIVLKIYSSNRAHPVYEITPTVPCGTHEKLDVLNLAYLQIPGLEHYDGCCKASTTRTEKHMRTTTHTSHKRKDHQRLTPRKQAQYVSPNKFQGKRKRKAQPLKWKKNVRKMRRCSGLDYTNTIGKHVEAKQIKVVDCRCRYKCNENFPQDARESIFKSYWSLGSYDRQKDFLCSNVLEKNPARLRADAQHRRACSRSYYFNQKHVCKAFFLKTLDI